MKKLLFVLFILVAPIAFGATVQYPLTVSKPIAVTLQSAATTGNGDVVKTDFALNYMVVEIVGSSGVTAGAIQVECASTCTYAGTWAPLGSTITVTASTATIVQVTAPVGCLRTRISTTVTDGTVTTKFWGVSR